MPETTGTPTMQTASGMSEAPMETTIDARDYVTVFVGETQFGLPIGRVHDVFVPHGITPVPHAPAEIVGLINLRGRVVTAMSLRRRLGVGDREPCSTQMAIGLEQGSETFALVVDRVGEVLRLDARTFEPVPINLDPRWRNLALGVHRLDGCLLVVFDVDTLLDFDGSIHPSIAA